MQIKKRHDSVNDYEPGDMSLLRAKTTKKSNKISKFTQP